MDWAWDLTELDTHDFDDDMGKTQNMEVFSGEDEIMMNKWNDGKHSTSPPASSKKPRVNANDQQMSCLVDGCTADLTNCRDYHRRHRVCETHSKTPVVTIAGKQQRFCQQCSRFHSLGEFDEVKRSCRKRLDGHNRRRRKPRAEFNYGSFLTNHQGTKLLRFGGAPAYTSTWPNKEKLNHKLHVTGGAKEKKFPFLLGTSFDFDKVNPESSFQQVVSTNASVDLLGEVSERLTQLVEPKGALSLLSKSSSSNLVQPLRFDGPLNQHPDPDLALRNVTGLNTGHANNHLIHHLKLGYFPGS